jgi:DNA-binding GntR family transcriptional regulator
MLESYCVRASAERISDEQIEWLRSILSGYDDLIEKRDIDALLDIDRKFHMGVVQCLDNRYIEQIANQIYDQVTRLWYLSFTSRTENELKVSARSHLDILEALAVRDPDLAAKTNQRHLVNFAEQIHKHFFGSTVNLVSGVSRTPSRKPVIHQLTKKKGREKK